MIESQPKKRIQKINQHMRKFLLVFLSLIYFGAQCQINKVTIQASGLTCSMCSNSINKAIKSIDYVDHVIANIKNSSFEVTFKPNANVDFDQLKKKVEGAGFFVAQFEASVNLDHLNVSNDAHVELFGKMFHFMNVVNQQLNDVVTLKVIDKGFVTSKEFKKNAKYTQMDCYKTGLMGSCCMQKLKSDGVRIYHVTI